MRLRHVAIYPEPSDPAQLCSLPPRTDAGGRHGRCGRFHRTEGLWHVSWLRGSQLSRLGSPGNLRTGKKNVPRRSTFPKALSRRSLLSFTDAGKSLSFSGTASWHRLLKVPDSGVFGMPERREFGRGVSSLPGGTTRPVSTRIRPDRPSDTARTRLFPARACTRAMVLSKTCWSYARISTSASVSCGARAAQTAARSTRRWPAPRRRFS